MSMSAMLELYSKSAPTLPTPTSRGPTHPRACANGYTAREDKSRWTLARFAVPMPFSRGSGGLLDMSLWQHLLLGFGARTSRPPAQGQSQHSRLDLDKPSLRHPALQPQWRPWVLSGLYALYIALRPHLKRMVLTATSAPLTPQRYRGHLLEDGECAIYPSYNPSICPRECLQPSSCCAPDRNSSAGR
ncbi:hypothetical protein VTK56DRAFT_6400 [Thermocarpiscus australiensis]